MRTTRNFKAKIFANKKGLHVKEGNSSNRVSSQVIVTAHSSFVNSDNGVHVNSVKEGNSLNRVSSQVIVTAHSSFVNSDNGVHVNSVKEGNSSNRVSSQVIVTAHSSFVNSDNGVHVNSVKEGNSLNRVSSQVIVTAHSSFVNSDNGVHVNSVKEGNSLNRVSSQVIVTAHSSFVNSDNGVHVNSVKEGNSSNRVSIKEGNSLNRVSSQVIVTAHSSFVNSDNGVHVNSVKEGNSLNRVSSQVIVTAHSSFVNSDNGENSIDASVQNTKSESVKSNSCDSVKVLALNVCDLKSKLKSPELEVLCNNNDILCFKRDIIKYTAETRCKVCLLGDFNAHTGTKTEFTEINDYVLNSVQLEDVINSVNLETLGIDVSRNSLDLSVNNYGNRLLQLCQNIELLIVNGRLGKDKCIGALTCKNTTIVDYCILSPELFPYISEFEVLPFDPMISDVHNALHVKILCKLIDIDKCMNSGEPSTIVKAVWDSKNLQSFNDCLKDENIVCLNDKLDAIDIASVSKDSINSLIEECNNIIIQAASECDDVDCIRNAVTNLNFELNSVITVDEVVKAIKSLKNNKSSGTDLILNEFLKNSCQKND
ncbi:uncharacterized protein [Mytilus edulis]|uniref:uncharacterized protein n=1 Tax=Mytilus edulis TaxID=6550 RepID=UPI0039F05A02